MVPFKNIIFVYSNWLITDIDIDTDDDDDDVPCFNDMPNVIQCGSDRSSLKFIVLIQTNQLEQEGSCYQIVKHTNLLTDITIIKDIVQSCFASSFAAAGLCFVRVIVCLLQNDNVVLWSWLPTRVTRWLHYFSMFGYWQQWNFPKSIKYKQK